MTWPVAIILILQAADAWSTWQCYRFGSGTEANPAVAWLITRLGLFWALAVAKGWAVALVAVGQFYGVWSGIWGTTILLFLFVFYVFVIFHNLLVLYGNKPPPAA